MYDTTRDGVDVDVQEDAAVIPYEEVTDVPATSHVTTSLIHVNGAASDDVDSSDEELLLTQETSDAGTPPSNTTTTSTATVIMPEKNYVWQCCVVFLIGLFAMVACILTLTTSVFD